MAALSDDVKQFIVQALACFDTPSQVAESVKEEFGLIVPRQQCETYDPTRAAGSRLSKKWRELFERTREDWRKGATEVPIANRIYRLRMLDQLARRAVSSRNAPLALQVLEQAAKETGDMFVNKSRPTGAAEDGDVPVPTKVVRGLVDARRRDDS